MASYVQARYTKIGYTYLMEPWIPVSQSFRKPYLVVWNEEEASVLDVTIMRDDQHPDTCYKQKLEYYDMSEIRKWVGETTGCRFIHFAVERYFLSRHRFKYSDYKIISLLWSKLPHVQALARNNLLANGHRWCVVGGRGVA